MKNHKAHNKALNRTDKPLTTMAYLTYTTNYYNYNQPTGLAAH